MKAYEIEAVERDEGTIVVFRGGGLLIAVEHRMAQGIIEALEAGHPVSVWAEPWQVVGVAR